MGPGRLEEAGNRDAFHNFLHDAIGSEGEEEGIAESDGGGIPGSADFASITKVFGVYFVTGSYLNGGPYDSYDEAVKAVEDSLAAGLGATAKVWRVDIPGKNETVFGVALKGKDADDCSGDEFVMSRVDKSSPRSTAHLPYEILVTDGDVEALYARFRIAINWPHLPMVASETGGTFFKIMCSPGAIEEALMQAAGEEP